MKTIISYLRHTLLEAILGPLFKMLEVCFELLVPVIVSFIVDVGVKNNDVTYIIYMCLLLVLFAILGLISALLAQYFSAKAAVKLSTNVRNDLFKKVQSFEYAELDKIGISTLVTRLTSDVNQVQTGVNMTLRLLLRSPVVVVGAIMVAFMINVEAGFIFLYTVPSLFLLIFIILLITIPLYAKSQNKLDDVVRTTRENLNGVRLVRAFNIQDKEKEKYLNQNNDLTKSQLFVGRISAMLNPLTYGLINLFVILLIYTGAINVEEGVLTQGNVIALYSLSGQILVEMVKFANLIITISKAISSSGRIEKILKMESKLEIKDSKKTNEDYIIEFKNVSMNYPLSNKNALNNISFNVKKGETIGIIGGTGSGKTTLINLIGHFYDINEGEIYFNGRNVASYDVKDLRNKISIVPQKAKLFKGTIESNLKFGNENASEEDLLRAIRIAQLEDVINKKDNGIKEICEVDGKNFSGGQKQRLSIARALVKKADILVLDDSSSALDYYTDSKLQKALKEIDDMTTFIVSQRTASLIHADKILVLDNGELVGVGTHEELLVTCEVYREIYESQFKKEGD